MNIKFSKAILAIVFLYVFSPIYGQDIPLKDARRFNLALLNVLDEYERTVSFSEKRDRQAFLKLFSDSDATCIYNDIMGSNDFQKMISPVTYVNNVPEDGSILLKSVLSNVKKDGDIFVSGGLLHRKVVLSKYLMLIDASVYTKGEGGVLFDSAQSFGKEPDFNLTIEFAYDPVSGQCKIYEISSAEPKKPSPFDERRFSVILKSSERYDKQLKSKGSPIVFNDFNQAVAYYNDVDVDNPDVYAQSVEYASGDRYNVLGLKFKPMYFRTKIYGGTSLDKAYAVSTSSPSINTSSRSLQAGVDLGFEVSMSPGWRLGLYSGIGLSISKINLSIMDVDYTLTYVNPARRYHFSATEDLSLTDIIVPLYMESEFSLAKRLVLDLDLGAKFYLNHGTKLGPYHISGEIGNQQIQSDYTSFRYPANYSRSLYDIALYVNAELDFRILSRFLYAYASYGYERGLSPSYDSGLHPFFNLTNQIYPFYYSPLAGKDIPYRSMVSSISYTRNAGMLSCGLKLKF